MDYEAAIDYMSRPLRKYRLNTAQKADDWIKRYIYQDLQTHHYCALLSFLTTVSLKGLHESPWLEAINSGNYFKAAHEMRQYVVFNGKVSSSLVKLRRAEATALLNIRIVAEAKGA